MKAIEVDSPEEAFERGLSAIMEEGEWVGEKREITNVVTEISGDSASTDTREQIERMLNDFHGPAEDGTPHVEVVSNWTFPEKHNTNLKGEPTARQDDGEYYRLLCDSPKGNQLESMAYKMEQWGRNNRTVAQVFRVEEHLNAMFPPCLMTLQAFYRDGDVSLTAYFRSHTIAKSYYGDIRSLMHLQRWLAGEIEAGIGSLVVHSGSLHIRTKNDEDELAEKMYNEVC